MLFLANFLSVFPTFNFVPSQFVVHLCLPDSHLPFSSSLLLTCFPIFCLPLTCYIFFLITAIFSLQRYFFLVYFMLILSSSSLFLSSSSPSFVSYPQSCLFSLVFGVFFPIFIFIFSCAFLSSHFPSKIAVLLISSPSFTGPQYRIAFLSYLTLLSLTFNISISLALLHPFFTSPFPFLLFLISCLMLRFSLFSFPASSSLPSTFPFLFPLAKHFPHLTSPFIFSPLLSLGFSTLLSPLAQSPSHVLSFPPFLFFRTLLLSIWRFSKNFQEAVVSSGTSGVRGKEKAGGRERERAGGRQEEQVGGKECW